MAKYYHVTVDWDKVNRTLDRADGIPTPVLIKSTELAEIVKTAASVAHPGYLYGQPNVQTLTDNDWAMLVSTFKTEREAQELAAMLNHQGPPIPSRKVKTDTGYQVISGPFTTKKEAKAAASRIRFDFEIEAKILEPMSGRAFAKSDPV